MGVKNFKNCKVTPPTIKHKRVLNDGRLTIKRIILEDFNSYQCVAQLGNSAVVSQSAKLKREHVSHLYSSTDYNPRQTILEQRKIL